jgi:hypothetical protein
VLGDIAKRIGLNHPRIAKSMAMPKIVSIITAPLYGYDTFNRVLAKRIANTTFSRR